MIKPITTDSIERYVRSHIPPGDFLMAVLSNNLTEAFGRADDENCAAMFEIVQFCYNNIPNHCWGSPQRVKAWLEWNGTAFTEDCREREPVTIKLAIIQPS